MNDAIARPRPNTRAPFEIVRRLIRLNNLLVFALVAAGLIGLAVARTWGAQRPGAAVGSLLLWARIVLPSAALVITAVVTQRALAAAARDLDEPVCAVSIAPVFDRCKRASMWMLAAAGVLAGGCLALGTTKDLLLAAVPLVLLLITRPSEQGFLSFLNLAVSMQEDASERAVAPAEADGGEGRD